MSLTKTAVFVKKLFRYLLIFVSSYYLLTLVIFPGSVSLIKAVFVKKTPPNPIYGQLDQLEFVEKPIGGITPEFVLDTKDGKLPQNLPDKMKVYKFKPQQYSYLAGKNAIAEAQLLGFTDADLVSDLRGNVYRWRKAQDSSNLAIDINSRSLTLTTNLVGRNANFTPGSINQDSAKQIAIKLLTSIYRFNDELYPSGTQTVRLGIYAGSKIYETTDRGEAQMALVDFYRSINGYNILGPDPSKGLMRVVVQNPGINPAPLNNPLMELDYWELETESQAEYPIAPVKEAWDVVRNGKGIITRVTPKNSNPFETYSQVDVEKIFINDIFLAYYETPKYQTYLQPIYVFAGTYTTRGTQGGEIVIYFPAISGQYTKQSQPQTPPQTTEGL